MASDKKIKILECIRQGQVGGGESHLFSLCTNLNRNLFDPIVLSFTDGPMIDMLKEKNIETQVIFTQKPFDIFVWKKVRKLLINKKIDIVHAHGTRANSNVFWAAKSLNIPLIYTIHGWSFHDNQKPFVKKIRAASERFLTSRAKVNISVSQSNKQTGINNIRSFTSVVINNGIDQEKFNPAKKFKDVRHELSINKEAILLLFIARVTLHKQPLALLKAFSIALKKIPTMKLLMVGEGDEKDAAVALAKDLKIEQCVVFETFRQDVPDVLNAADIFILPSLWEGLPIGLLEAMSMGKAVIATNVDGTSEIIKHNSNGLLVELKNLVNELAEAIILLANDNTLRQRYSEKAKETISNQFDVAKMTAQIEHIYTSINN